MSIGQNENPRGGTLWGFLVHYGEPLRLGCCCLFISVQPFTNVVANYACQYRDKESYYVLHRVSPPFCWRFDSIFILPYLPTGFYRFRIFPCCDVAINIRLNPAGREIPDHLLRTCPWAFSGSRSGPRSL